MFCRHGGVSQPPFASLNLSFHVGDNPAHVTANRQAVKQHLGLEHLASAVQVHGDRVVLAEHVKKDREYAAADALITRLLGQVKAKEVTFQIMVLQNDQTEIVTYKRGEPVKRTVADLATEAVKDIQ
ncbi:hypothetical protein GCAAIG_03075 [Candidatus Electronema halotolerans]